MRSGYFVTSLVGIMLATGLLSAQPADGAAPSDAAPPPPPPGGYPPPPPGGYPPPPPGYYAQEAPPVERTAFNSLYIEGLGPGLLYSLNYDRIFGDFAGRVGFSYLSLSNSSTSSDGQSGGEAHATFLTVPLTITYLGLGSKKNIFEIGAGATILHAGAGASVFSTNDATSGNASATVLFGNMIFGYRLQPPQGGFVLRTGLSPIFGHGVFLPLPYLALGGTF